MKIKQEQKQIVKQLELVIKLENEQEIQAFKNILTHANMELYRQYRDQRLDLEQDLLFELQKLIGL